jgi:hypothetical protein
MAHWTAAGYWTARRSHYRGSRGSGQAAEFATRRTMHGLRRTRATAENASTTGAPSHRGRGVQGCLAAAGVSEGMEGLVVVPFRVHGGSARQRLFLLSEDREGRYTAGERRRQKLVRPMFRCGPAVNGDRWPTRDHGEAKGVLSCPFLAPAVRFAWRVRLPRSRMKKGPVPPREGPAPTTSSKELTVKVYHIFPRRREIYGDHGEAVAGRLPRNQPQRRGCRIDPKPPARRLSVLLLERRAA